MPMISTKIPIGMPTDGADDEVSLAAEDHPAVHAAGLVLSGDDRHAADVPPATVVHHPQLGDPRQS